jgi:Uncharacterized protein conserved in bacteria
MLIDEMKPQKGHLVGLYSEGELIVSVDCELAAEKNIRAGREYSIDELRELLSDSQLRRAKSKALYLLNFRDYSRRDLAARLRSDNEYSDEAIEAALDYMTEIGAVDDARYAENMIRHLIHQKHYGRRRILQELSAKGIDRYTAETALREFDLDEQAAILELLDKKFSRDLDNDKGIRRTIATLQRYGYEMGDIMQALRDYADQIDQDEDSE